MTTKKQCWWCGRKSDLASSEIIIDSRTRESKPICWECCDRGLEWVEQMIEERAIKRRGRPKINHAHVQN